MAKRQLFPALQGLRFFAILVVVISHASGNGFTKHVFLSNLASVSVQFFFVVSGFLCACHHLDGMFANMELFTDKLYHGWKFLLRRVRRFYPLHIATFLSMAALYVILPDVHWDATMACNVVLQLLVLQSWFPSAAISFNSVAWFLSSLCAIYFFLPFFVHWTARRSTSCIMAAFAGLMFFRMVGDAFYMWEWTTYGVDAMVAWMYECPLYRVTDFLIGFWGWRLLGDASRGGELVRTGGMCGGIALLAGILFCAPPFPGGRYTLPVWMSLLLLLVIRAACHPGALFEHILANRWMISGGNASFELYLIHFPVLQWLLFALPNAGDGGTLLTLAISLVLVEIVRWAREKRRVLHA